MNKNKSVNKNISTYKTSFFNLFATTELKKYANTINGGKFVVIVTKKNGNAVRRFRIKRKIYSALRDADIKLSGHVMYTFVGFDKILDVYHDELRDQIINSIRRIKLPN